MSQKTKRLFWAVNPELPETILKSREEFKQALKDEQLKWVPPENLHFTLKFLGDTPAEKLEELLKIGNETARVISAFDLKINGFGAFYSQKKPKVIFFKTYENEMLYKLAKHLDAACAELGFEPESRPFKAHLTLARVKYIRNLSYFNSLLRQSLEANLPVDSFSLIESRLSSQGAKYSVLSKFLLR